VDWCIQASCDVTADLKIDLLPASGADVNADVQIGDVTVTSGIGFEAEDSDPPGVVEVTVTPILVP
jgi:hypothetical protein